MYGTLDRTPRRPSWVSLYALAAGILGVFGVADVFVPAGRWRRALEIVITVMAVAAIHIWVCANRRALDLAGARDTGFRTIVIPAEAPPPTPRRDRGVTRLDSRGSQHVAGRRARRGGKRWTSSISG